MIRGVAYDLPQFCVRGVRWRIAQCACDCRVIVAGQQAIQGEV